jgi:adenosyl cobinamide kinase/adenosyl cobinamide phosphate guanylyltransferase
VLELYLGGARSGKSRLAENQAERQAQLNNKLPIYLATATAGDQEMAERIALHQLRRGESKQQIRWRTVEEPLQLADTLITLDNPQHCIVVDCLTLWISNLLLHPSPEMWLTQRRRLIECVSSLNSHVLFVSNEVGQGVVPANELSRRFVDESGFLHQELAGHCDRVVFTVAGLPQVLKGEPM